MGCKILISGHVTVTTPFSVTICHRQAGHAMVNLPTKFEVSTVSRYGDMKCVKIAQNGGGLEWLGVTQGHRQCHHSIERIRFPIRL